MYLNTYYQVLHVHVLLYRYYMYSTGTVLVVVLLVLLVPVQCHIHTAAKLFETVATVSGADAQYLGQAMPARLAPRATVPHRPPVPTGAGPRASTAGVRGGAAPAPTIGKKVLSKKAPSLTKKLITALKNQCAMFSVARAVEGLREKKVPMLELRGALEEAAAWQAERRHDAGGRGEGQRMVDALQPGARGGLPNLGLGLMGACVERLGGTLTKLANTATESVVKSRIDDPSSILLIGQSLSVSLSLSLSLCLSCCEPDVMRVLCACSVRVQLRLAAALPRPYATLRHIPHHGDHEPARGRQGQGQVPCSPACPPACLPACVDVQFW